jgi:hypothetical protein
MFLSIIIKVVGVGTVEGGCKLPCIRSDEKEEMIISKKEN